MKGVIKFKERERERAPHRDFNPFVNREGRCTLGFFLPFTQKIIWRHPYMKFLT